jgi:hypothetical protein
MVVRREEERLLFEQKKGEERRRGGKGEGGEERVFPFLVLLPHATTCTQHASQHTHTYSDSVRPTQKLPPS